MYKTRCKLGTREREWGPLGGGTSPARLLHVMKFAVKYYHEILFRARLHTGKFSSNKKISFVLNPLVAHGSSQDKEKLPVQGKFFCV